MVIPTNISRYAYYSATFLLLNSLLAFKLKYYITSTLLAIVYITTLLHWSEIKKISTIKILDIIFVFLTIINWTFFDIKTINNFGRNVWYITLFLIAIIFTTNEILFYYQVLKYSNKYYEYATPYKKWSYFTLNYTNPNTKSRNLAYYRVAFTHMLFIHIFPQIVLAYCASFYRNNEL